MAARSSTNSQNDEQKDVEEAKQLREMGAVHFISKPSDPDEIYYVVSFVLEEQLNQRKNPT